MYDFINEYFINPITTGEGYNPVNTTVYALLTVALAYILFKILKKFKVKIDKRFALSISPYVLLGGILRVWQDVGLVSNIWFVTPFIFLWGSILVISILLASLFLEKKFKIPYYKIMFIVGLTAVFIFASPLKIVNFYRGFLILLFYLPWLVIFGFINFWKIENRIVMLIHMLDASATFVALQFFNYFELHVVPTFFIDLFGPLSFLFLKLTGIALFLILIDKYSQDKELNNYIKIGMGIIGGFTASRDIIKLLVLFV